MYVWVKLCIVPKSVAETIRNYFHISKQFTQNFSVFLLKFSENSLIQNYHIKKCMIYSPISIYHAFFIMKDRFYPDSIVFNKTLSKIDCFI
jgi:hypothetical protein